MEDATRGFAKGVLGQAGLGVAGRGFGLRAPAVNAWFALALPLLSALTACDSSSSTPVVVPTPMAQAAPVQAVAAPAAAPASPAPQPGFLTDARTRCQVWTGWVNATTVVNWSGPCVNGRAQGRGTATWRYTDQGGEQTQRYVGDMRQGWRQGRGRWEHVGGDVYEGEFANDRLNGQGNVRFANGGTLTGRFVDNRLSGHGVNVGADGGRYEGGFLNGRQSGAGTLVLPDGQRYTGNWANGEKNGYGVQVWPRGSRYEGNWVNGVADGWGAYSDPSQNIAFRAYFRNGCGIDRTEVAGVILTQRAWVADAGMGGVAGCP
ncbi:MORN repeat-containing protein [Roseomonas sp. CECT 9278]|uniref:MORN repeat-containing protein n=1 Tax=Roseomonas sp. CECT 9278 TaxID=2845823 RepID=UPI001E3D525E|nr:hypothetical protein [Roseomonas sp. CECT 9278]CAH0186815.1 hypothetical protein ROS9278_01583 [Roseomonas sp. CECT 9278]